MVIFVRAYSWKSLASPPELCMLFNGAPTDVYKILLGTVLVNPVRQKTVTIGSCHLILRTKWQTRTAIFSRRAKDCGMTLMPNHYKAVVRELVSQPIMAYVGHISWQLTVATLLAVSADTVGRTPYVHLELWTNHQQVQLHVLLCCVRLLVSFGHFSDNYLFCFLIDAPLKIGVLQREPHRRSGLVTLPSVGAVP